MWGLRYSLADKPLESAAHGPSNEAISKDACLTVTQGMILICVDGGEAWPVLDTTVAHGEPRTPTIEHGSAYEEEEQCLSSSIDVRSAAT